MQVIFKQYSETLFGVKINSDVFILDKFGQKYYAAKPYGSWLIYDYHGKTIPRTEDLGEEILAVIGTYLDSTIPAPPPSKANKFAGLFRKK